MAGERLDRARVLDGDGPLVRQDHVVMSRMLDDAQRVVGSAIGGSKIGGDVDDAFVLFPDPMGATGAMYAMRRSLWRPLPPDTILDDVLAPMRCVLAGFRVVFADRACAFDRTARDARTESLRKRRTLAGNYQLLWLEPSLLLPWRNPAWIQFVSHKVARLAVPFALPPLWLLSFVLSRRSPVYAMAFTVQCLFYLFAGYGAWLEKHDTGTPRDRRPTLAAVPERLARVALMVLVMNASAVAGLASVLTRQKVWR